MEEYGPTLQEVIEYGDKIQEIYDNCIGLLAKREDENNRVAAKRNNKPFQSFRIKPPKGFFVTHDFIASGIAITSATYVSTQERESYKDSPITINLRTIQPSMMNEYPQVVIAIPQDGVSMFMLIENHKARRIIDGGTRIATQSDVTILHGLILTATERGENPEDDPVIDDNIANKPKSTSVVSLGGDVYSSYDI